MKMMLECIYTYLFANQIENFSLTKVVRWDKWNRLLSNIAILSHLYNTGFGILGTKNFYLKKSGEKVG